MNKKKIIITAIIIVVLGAVCTGLFLNSKKQNNNAPTEDKTVTEEQKTEPEKAAEKTDEGKAEPQKKSESVTKNGEESQNEKTPVFMYFVSESDANYDDAIKVFEELKNEYSGKIEFELKNVTKDPDLLQNFSLVDGNTPALIMDGKEGIVGFQFKMTDKDTLKSEIEKALK